MNKPGTIIAIVAVLVALGILTISFAGGVDPKKFPPQANGTFTGYPVWHPPLKEGNDNQQNDATIIFSVICLIISGSFALKWTFDANTKSKLTYFVDRDSKKTTTTTFDRLLAFYALITSLTGIVYYTIDVGKIWATVGVLHNAIEVTILVSLHQGGKITSTSFAAWLTFYVLLATALSMYLDWPFDALWFKVQGLCSDYALVIQFTRLYFNTRRGFGDGSHRPLLDPESNNTSEESDGDNTTAISEFRPYYLLFLVLASSAHIFGNLLTTIWIYEFYSYVAFSFTYCITYPAYAYFVYLDTHSVAISPAKKYIILPDNTTPKVILVTLSAIFLSLFTAKLGTL